MPRPSRIHPEAVFGDWTVVERVGSRSWRCMCSCGVEREVTTGNLTTGHSTSCGHGRLDAMHEASTIHGHAAQPTPEYLFWQEAKKNCTDPSRASYAKYGGAGIRMHAAWASSFARFIREVAPCPKAGMVLGRKNKRKDFKPGNVAWMTSRARQLRKSTARWVVIDGERKQLQEWADEYGIKKNTLHWRIKHWPPERWLERPNDPRKLFASR